VCAGSATFRAKHTWLKKRFEAIGFKQIFIIRRIIIQAIYRRSETIH